MAVTDDGTALLRPDSGEAASYGVPDAANILSVQWVK
jgi:hypothetical protein